jgi:hypothetical protein
MHVTVTVGPPSGSQLALYEHGVDAMLQVEQAAMLSGTLAGQLPAGETSFPTIQRPPVQTALVPWQDCP